MADPSEETNTSNAKYNLESLLGLDKEEDRTVGSLMGCFIGDALGAPVEGWSPIRIQRKYGLLKDIEFGSHMGMPQAGLRKGMYTDDTNSTLALAHSLVSRGCLVPHDCAHQYGRFWQSKPRRGYPDSAQKVMLDVLKGEDIMKAGTKVFPEGSFANGGAMRISPIGIGFRNATPDQRHEAVRMAIVSSHVHPQAVDGAWLIASAISKLFSVSSSSLAPLEFLSHIISISRDDTMKSRLIVVQSLVTKYLEFHNTSSNNSSSQPVHNDTNQTENDKTQKNAIPSITQVGQLLGDEFQIKAVDAVACALYCVCTNWENPEKCLIMAVAMGGDTDTVAAIAGSVIGALHGTKWIPPRWFDPLENGARGRDWVIDLGKQLSKLNLSDIHHATPEEIKEIEAESAKVEIETESGCATQ